MENLSSKIKELAFAQGFHQAGITHVRSLAEGEQAIRDWTLQSRHGSMKYLEDFEQRRRNFFKDIPDASAVIVLGLNYYNDVNTFQNEKLFGKIARYAWGKDYHEIIRAKHAKLIEAVRQIAGASFKAKSCVDIQPLPEKFSARRAGLGFVGKNTLVLSKEYGPWLFLSEIITNLGLPEDLPAQGDCGTCRSCQAVCPTGALDQDYNMDARLCIAYLTIEHKGIIPRGLRSKIKNWVFGCDECLDTCPFTSKSKQTNCEELTAVSGFGPELDLKKIFSIRSNMEYKKAFAGTALLRASRKQLLRNACVVLGNSQKEEAVAFLQKALEDPAWLVRLHAAWALGQFRGGKTKALLQKRLAWEPEPQVREEIECSLKSLPECR